MSQPASDDYGYRCTDRMVRERHSLKRCAEEFLRSYGGDFEFLTGAKSFLEIRGPLPVAMTRGVLNCMRSDPQGQHMLKGFREELPPRPRLEVVERRRPAWINLPSEWHYDFVYSTAKTAQVVHYLDRKRSAVRWYPHTGQFELRLFSHCKPLYKRLYHEAGEPSYLFASHVIEGRRMCPLCMRRAS